MASDKVWNSLVLTLEGGAGVPRAGPNWPSPRDAAARSWSRRLLNFLLGCGVLQLLGARMDGGGRRPGHDPAGENSSVRSPGLMATGVQVAHGTRAGAQSRGGVVGRGLGAGNHSYLIARGQAHDRKTQDPAFLTTCMTRIDPSQLPSAALAEPRVPGAAPAP